MRILIRIMYGFWAVHAIIIIVVLYSLALLLYPLRKKLIKTTVSFFIKIYYRFWGMIFQTSSPPGLPEKNVLFVCAKTDIRLHAILYAVLPGNTYFLWNEQEFPPFFFFFLKNFMVLPLNGKNPILQRKQVTGLSNLSQNYNLSIMFNSKVAYSIKHMDYSSTAAFIALEHGYTVVPVSFKNLPGFYTFNFFNPKKVNILMGTLINVTGLSQTKETRLKLTEVIYKELLKLMG